MCGVLGALAEIRATSRLDEAGKGRRRKMDRLQRTGLAIDKGGSIPTLLTNLTNLVDNPEFTSCRDASC